MDIIINYILFQKKKKKKKKKEKSNITKAEFLYSMVFWGIPSQSLKKKKKIRKQFGGKIRAKCTVERSNIISSL